jgi:hypothetical protein
VSIRRVAAIAACAAGALSATARADLVVPAGSVSSLDGGAAELACTDVVVGGTLAVGSAPVTNVRNLTIQSGGVVTFTTGSISVGGSFSNQGTVAPGSGGVVFGNACGAGPAPHYPVPASSGGGLAALAALVAAAALVSRRRLRS